MRTRVIAFIALSTASVLASMPREAGAQFRLPRPSTRTRPDPAPLPPEVPAVTRALAYRRSRWTAESYTMISNVQVPAASGSNNYTTFATGTRGSFRYTDHFSATVDLTDTPFGGPATTQTVELGTRYSPLPWEQQLRPFFDVRATYLRMYDTFDVPVSPAIPINGLGSEYGELGRYSRGWGSVAGAGLDYSITRMIALSSELSAVRGRMTAYRFTGVGGLPTGTSYWLTSFRYTLGVKISPVRSLSLSQNPRQ